MTKATIGVIGGSGVYQVEDMNIIDEVDLNTPFGRPSDTIHIGNFGSGPNLAFLARHGRGHRLLPSEVPSRANIHALKQLGVQYILSVSAVGSLKHEIAPTHMVVPDQIIDRTRSRDNSYFGEGIVGHVAFADPFCDSMRQVLLEAVRRHSDHVHDGGTYVCMEGPLFSTRAESNLYRSWGASVIGMTALPEAKLAREAEICYATLAMATDYDCWHEEEEDVSVEMIVGFMKKNTEVAKKVIRTLAELHDKLPESCVCHSAARFAIFTDKALFPDKTREKLELFYGKYWS